MKQRFNQYATQHVYQRAIDRGVVFYSVSDRLVYYTLASVKSKKHGIRVLAASIMFTHVHQSLLARSFLSLCNYLHDADTSFTRLYNSRHSRKGPLFEKPPGRSQKVSSKEQRSNLIYVYNNHVEKGICRSALEERWSFLAYAVSPHPFSKEIEPLTLSRAMARALKLVDRRVASNRALEYSDLDAIFARLTGEERLQFVDYVIYRYGWIDFDLAKSHFDSVEDMIRAIDSTTGSEYDIREDYSRDKDTGYVALAQKAAAECYLWEIYALSGDRLMAAVKTSLDTAGVSRDQVRRFFHLSEATPAATALLPIMPPADGAEYGFADGAESESLRGLSMDVLSSGQLAESSSSEPVDEASAGPPSVPSVMQAD